MEGLAYIQQAIWDKQAAGEYAARIRRRFERLEALGLVRLQVLPDVEMYDDSYIDTWSDVSAEERNMYRRSLWVRIEREGVWGVVGEFRPDPRGPWLAWEHADSCWGFIGDDWQSGYGKTGYDVECMDVTIDALRVAIRNRRRP